MSLTYVHIIHIPSTPLMALGANRITRVRQYTIVCLYGDLLGARVNVLIWEIGEGAGVCIYLMIWHMRGYCVVILI